jgi:hypothetical protein
MIKKTLLDSHTGKDLIKTLKDISYSDESIENRTKATFLVGNLATEFLGVTEYQDTIIKIFKHMAKIVLEHQIMQESLNTLEFSNVDNIVHSYLAMGKFAKMKVKDENLSPNFMQDLILYMAYQEFSQISIYMKANRFKESEIPPSHSFLVSAIISCLNNHVLIFKLD